MSVSRAQREIGSREFTEWMAFYSVEPFGPERLDLAAGIIAASYYETKRDPKKRSKPFTFKDFIPRYAWEDEAESAPEVPQEVLTEKIMGLFRSFGGKAVKREKKS